MRAFLFSISFIAFSFTTIAQKQSGDVWLKTIKGNAINKAGAGGIFWPAKPGFALYFSASGQENVPYLVCVPKNYDPKKATPMAVFLHGAILGRDNFFHNEDPATADEPVFTVADEYNTIVVFPFGKSGFMWPSQVAANENIIKIATQVKERYNIDNKKVFLGGISMGGMATFWFMKNKADYFSGFYTFSAIPGEDMDFSKITPEKPLYTTNAKDDPGFPFTEISRIYESHKNEAKGWHFKYTETGGHRFIYNVSGYRYVKYVVGELLKP